MSRFVRSALAALVAAGQVVVGGLGPVQRDPQQPQVPQVRRIAVGTASISGIVTTADTGRPVRGARVAVSGVMTAALNGGLTALSFVGNAPAASLPGATTSAAGPAGGRAGGAMPPMNTSRTAITDAQGAFSIDHLPAGQYSIDASRNPFLNTSYGQKKPGGPGTPLPVADGQKLSLKLELIRGGVISGRVTGEDGEPLGGTQIRAFKLVNNNGVKRMQGQGYANSDDRGEYRMFGLQPGDYIVSATPNNNDGMMYDRMLSDTNLIEQAIASGAVQPPAAPGLPATVAITMPTPSMPQGPQFEMGSPGYLQVYHPAAAAPLDATKVSVAGGDDHPNVDIQVRLIQATNIQGTVANAPGGETAVQLMLVNDDPMFESTGSSRVDPNGRFTFRNIAPGKYTIVAQVVSAPTVTIVNGMSQQPSGPPKPLDDAQKMWGRTSIEVEGQPLINTSVTMRPGRTVSGQVVFEMERPPDLTRAKLTVGLSNPPGSSMPMYGQTPQAEIGPDGRFTLTAVAPGRYTFRLPGLAKSAVVEGRDTLDGGFNFTGARDVTDAVLTVTDKYTEITGVLTDGTGKPATTFTVIAAAIEERFWTPGSRRIAVSRPMPDGRYNFRNLPPGTYVVAAVADLEPGGQYDPELLKSLATAGAMRITLMEGTRMAQDLRVVR